MTAAAEVRTRKRLRITPRAALLALVILALLLYLLVPLKGYLAQRSRLDDLARQTHTLEQQNAALRQEVRRLKSPEYVEQLARCLGMVRPGEIAFVTVPKKGAPEPAPC
ncbi:MAG TPA: septum formation initiator family protein [Actinomycetota bacterium]|nr:septum formation initiator family protein [Actinomycetota bacterium]